MKLENYEFVCIFIKDTSEQAVRSIVSEYTLKIRESGGNIKKTEFCGMRTFAYPIKKKHKGYYVLLNLQLPVSFIKDFEKTLKVDGRILRYLLLNVKELDPNPSELLKQRYNLDATYKAQIRSGKVYNKNSEGNNE